MTTGTSIQTIPISKDNVTAVVVFAFLPAPNPISCMHSSVRAQHSSQVVHKRALLFVFLALENVWVLISLCKVKICEGNLNLLFHFWIELIRSLRLQSQKFLKWNFESVLVDYVLTRHITGCDTLIVNRIPIDALEERMLLDVCRVEQTFWRLLF